MARSSRNSKGHSRAAGWNVIKVVTGGSDWDLLAKDTDGVLVRRMDEIVDGQYQKYSVMPGSYIREHFSASTSASIARRRSDR